MESLYPGKQSEMLEIKIITKKLTKKPSQSFFKSYLKLAANKTLFSQSDKLGMDIERTTGLYALTRFEYRKKRISGIEFISIEEY